MVYRTKIIDVVEHRQMILNVWDELDQRAIDAFPKQRRARLTHAARLMRTFGPPIVIVDFFVQNVTTIPFHIHHNYIRLQRSAIKLN